MHDDGVGGERERGSLGNLDPAMAPFGDQGSAVPGGIVAARGTNDGFVLRLDARVDTASLRDAVAEFMMARRSFLSGSEISLEWIGHKPDEIMVAEISSLLSQDFSVTVKSSKVRDATRPRVFAGPDGFHEETTSTGLVADRFARQGDEGRGLSTRIEQEGSKRASTLFDGLEAFSGSRAARSSGVEVAPALNRQDPTRGFETRLAADSSLWDEPDARVVYGTIRSGQKIESEHTIVVCGDVNSGAEIVSGGDVIVLGTLRGIAHAGAYEETGGGRIIVAMNLQPTQLRIGTIISRGPGEGAAGRGASSDQVAAELARVDNGMIVVERYNPKNVLGKRL